MLYSFVFAYLLLLFFILKHTKGRQKNIEFAYSLLCFIVLSLMSACRFEIGARSDMYRNYMNTYRSAFMSWKEILSISPEFLNQILRKALITITNDPQTYFFVTGFFIVGISLFSIRRYSSDVFMGVILYYVWGGYFSSNNITRQYIAISITMIAIKWILEEDALRFAIYIIIAVGFHLSAVVTIPLFFLSKRTFNKMFLYFYIMMAAVLVAFNGPFTRFIQLFMYSEYGSAYGAESSNPIRLIWPLFVFVCLLVINNNHYKCVPSILANDSRKIVLFNNLINHGSILYIYFSLLSAVNMLLFSRVAAYFVFYAMCVMLYGNRAALKKNNKVVLRLCLWLLAILWFVIMNYAGKYIPTPYTPFWYYPWRALIQ